MYVVKCAIWYIILVTTFTNFVLDTNTSLQPIAYPGRMRGGGGGGAAAPPLYGMSTKMQNKKKKHVFITSEIVVCTGMG